MPNSEYLAQKFTRRELLRHTAAAGMVLALPGGLKAAPHRQYAAEAARLTRAVMGCFWDSGSKMFRAPVLSAETVSSDALHDRGCVFWPSLLALHALVEGEGHSPGQYAKQIAEVYAGLEQYFSPALSAYTAWVQFPGNQDAYYDDNSWAVIVLVEAFLACRKSDPAHAENYLLRAKAIMAMYVVKGYDNAGPPGGTRWGSDPAKPNTSDRGTSSTAGSALAAMMLARAGVETEFYVIWGHKLLTWLTDRLQDMDGLMMDALVPPDWTPRRIKWTYNTGVPIRAYAEHYRLTGSENSLAQATRLARNAVAQNEALFDQAVHDIHKRFYWDSIYFVQYLADGLLQAAEVTHDHALAAKIRATLAQSTDYAYTYLRDSVDGFYWRNYRLYTIGTAQHKVWEQWTGQSITPAYDASERSQEPKYRTLAVQDRPLVKTLLADAGAARLFWLAARLPTAEK